MCIYIYIYMYIYTCIYNLPIYDLRKPPRKLGLLSGSQRTTATNEPLPFCPVSKRVGMSHFVKSPLVTAFLVTRL